MAASFQKAAIETLLIKTKWALDKHPSKTLILCGGVSANASLKKQFIATANERQIQLRVPKPIPLYR